MSVQTGGYVTEIGDALLIHPINPFIGVSSIASFTDDIDNDTGSRYFDKFFRWSTTGFDWSEYQVLSNANLQALSLNSKLPFYIQYRYVRAGADATSYIKLNSITLNLNTVDFECGEKYKASVFNSFFACSDPNVIAWCSNVLEKMYRQGIVPKYIKRGDEIENDDDYISLWRTICCFFSYFVHYARIFDDYYSNADILRNYLQGKNIFLCGDESLSQLQEITKDLFNQVRRRGTDMPFKVDPDENGVNGEILRLLCYSSCNELIKAISPFNGWTVDRTSPIYKGTYGDPGFTKGFENQEGITGLTPYPTSGNPSYNSSSNIVLFQPGDGFGYFSGDDSANIAKAFTISPNLGYIVRVRLNQLSGSNNENISFGFTAFDSDDNEVSLKSIVDGSDSKWFFEDQAMPKEGRYYNLYGIVFPSSEANRAVSDALLNIGVGNHLKWPETACKALPLLQCTESDSSNFQIEEFKVYLLNTDYSRGFFHTSPILELFAKNNNPNYTNNQIEQIIRRYFVPYNMGLNLNYLS